ncbi:creatininase family protein [Aquiluna borgnonia]|uniref:Creatininase family protein n=1 Tax=Aquiluna borgnonia TaxID=2499157 RepID=A0A7D4UMF7_9MICO|nr:creatininase family protein [Aquiluna borgnonia]
MQMELMRPGQLRDALAKRSVVFIPIGAFEFHQEHLPFGLDALNAHGLTCLTAHRFGGAVLPPLYYGTGGSHKSYPWTIMMNDEVEIRGMLEQTLTRLQELGVKVAVIFSGHFAPEQLEMISSIAERWRQGANYMKVIDLAINMPLDSTPSPDHAGVFETTVLSRFEPLTIDLSQLPSIDKVPAIDPDGDSYGLHRHDPSHVLWGVFGEDPRKYQPAEAHALALKLSEAIELSVGSALAD